LFRSPASASAAAPSGRAVRTRDHASAASRAAIASRTCRSHWGVESRGKPKFWAWTLSRSMSGMKWYMPDIGAHSSRTASARTCGVWSRTRRIPAALSITEMLMARTLNVDPTPRSTRLLDQHSRSVRLALNRLGEPGRDRRRVGDRSAHDDRLGAGPTGGSGLIGCVDAAFGDEHRSQTGPTDGADEFEIGAGDRCALAGVAGQGGADDVGTGL